MGIPRPNPTLIKTVKGSVGLLTLLLIILTGACIDKQEILKEGTRVVIPGDDISIAGILYGPDDPGKSVFRSTSKADAAGKAEYHKT